MQSRQHPGCPPDRSSRIPEFGDWISYIIGSRDSDRSRSSGDYSNISSDTGSASTRSLKFGGKTFRSIFALSLLVIAFLLVAPSPAQAASYKVDTSTGWQEGVLNTTADEDGILKLIDASVEIWSFTGHTGDVNGVSVGPDGRFVFSGGDDSSVRKVWTNNGSEVWDYNAPSFVYSVSVGPDGDFVYGGGLNNELYKLWAGNGSEVWSFTGHTNIVNSVSAGPDGSFVYSGSVDESVRKVWAVNGSEVWSFTGHTDDVDGVSAGPNGSFVYSVAGAGTFSNVALRKVWTSNGSEVWNFTGHTYGISSVSVDPSGRFVFSGGDYNDEKIFKVWTGNGSEVWKITSDTPAIEGLSVGPNAEVLYSGSYRSLRKLWSRNGSEIWDFSGHTDDVDGVSAGPNGNFVYSGSEDETVRKISDGYSNGTYRSKIFGSGSGVTWFNLTFNSSFDNFEEINATVEVSDSRGFGNNVKDSQNISLSDGLRNYSLDLQEATYTRLNISLFSYRANETPSIDSFTLWTSDNNPPKPQIIHPPNGSTTDPLWLNVTADESIDSWKYNVDSDSNTSFDPNIVLSGVSVGRHNVTVWAEDSVGNWNSTVTWFRVDREPPNPKITSPPNKTINDSTPWLNVTADEDISKWKYSLDGLSNTSFSRNITLPDLWDGGHDVTVWARDVAGNWNRTNIRVFRVDTNASRFRVDGSDEWLRGVFSDSREKFGGLKRGVGASSPASSWSFDGHTGIVNDLSAGPDSRFVYSVGGYDDETVRKVWTRNGSEVWKFTDNSYAVTGVSAGPNGDFVYSASEVTAEAVRKLWASNGSEVWEYPDFDFKDVSVGPDGRFVYSGDADESVRKVWAVNGSEVWSFTGHTDNVEGVSAGPDGSFVYSGGADDVVRKLWGGNGSWVWNFTGHTGRVNGVSAGPDGDFVYSVSDDSSVRKVWTENGSEVWSFTGHTNYVRGVSAGPDGDFVYSVSDDDSVRKVWTGNGSAVWKFTGHTFNVYGVSAGPDGSFVYSGGADDVVRRVSNGFVNGSYRSWVFEEDFALNWYELTVDADVEGWDSLNATVEISDSEGFNTVKDSVEVEISDGLNNYSLGLDAAEYGRVNFSLSSSRLNSTPVVDSFSIWTADREEPDLLVSSPPNSTVGDDNPWLNVSANEPISIWRYNVDSDSNSSFSPNITLPSLSEGSHNITVWGKDTAVNWNRTVTEFRVDLTPPDWRNQGENTSSISPEGSIELSVQGQDGVNLSHAVLSTNESGSYVNKTGVYGSPRRVYGEDVWRWSNFTWRNGSVNGSVGWKVWYNDTAGNWNVTDVLSFTVDVWGPNVVIDSPVNGSTSDTTPWLNVTADEDVSAWKYNVDSDGNSSFTPNITLSSLSDGSHNVTVWANDSLGNWNRSVLYFRVDTQPPTLDDLRFDSSVDVDRFNTTITINSSDPRGVSTVIIQENSTGSPRNYTMRNQTGDRFNYTLNSSSTGPVGFTVYSNDSVDNLATSTGIVRFQNVTLPLRVDTSRSIDTETRANITPLLQPRKSFTSVNTTVSLSGTVVDSNTTEENPYALVNFTTLSTPGNHTLKINASNNDSIEGSNSTRISLYNLSIHNLTKEGDIDIFKDSDSNPDHSFADNLTSDGLNPTDLSNVNYDYSIPSNWSIFNTNNFFSTLEPGESVQNSPDVDIGQSAALGPQTITLEATSDEGISDSSNLSVTVWTKSEAELRSGTPDVVNKNENYFLLHADVYDTVNDSSLEDINATFTIDGGNSQEVTSNASGIATLNWSVKNYDTGTHTIAVTSEDHPDRYINSTGNIDSKNIDILGTIVRESYTQSDEKVYRKDGSTPESTTLAVTVDDSQGSDLNNTYVSFYINGTLQTCTTGTGGSCSISYNPPNSTIPDNHTIRINATKDEFDTLRFNSSVEIRGKLSIQEKIERVSFNRGTSHDLESTVQDEFGSSAYGNVTWTLNGSRIASSQNTTWTPSTSRNRGSYNLTARTNREFLDNDTSTTRIQVYGNSDLSSLSPTDSTVTPNETIPVKADVVDSNTSSAVSGMPVTFRVNGSFQTTKTTNSTGTALFNWDPEPGAYNLSASIQDNSSIRYNVSESLKHHVIKVDRELLLERFDVSEREIFRNDIKDPHDTTFTVNVTEPSNSDLRDNANETVLFEINSTENVSCTTGSDGKCSVTYNADSSDIGNVTLNVSTFREGWENIRKESYLVVQGILTAAIDSPSSGRIHRGDRIALNGSTTLGVEEVSNVESNWTFAGTHIKDGKNVFWDVPLSESLGDGTLEFQAGGRLYSVSSSSQTQTVFGRSRPNITSPDNSSDISIGRSPTLRCDVLDQQDNGIEDYPVIFYENDTQIGTGKTDSNGEATATWNIPDRVGRFNISCVIGDNSTLNYNDSVSVDSRMFDTKDDVKPNINNLTARPDPADLDEQVNITFNASDSVGLRNTDVEVERPDGSTETLSVTNTTGTGFEAVFDTSGESEGGYTVTVEANDTSGNLASQLVTFDINPGGTISVSPSKVTADNITTYQNQSFNVDVKFTAEETANYTNITSSTDSSNLFVNDTSVRCGGLLANETCNVSIRVSVNSSTTSGSLFATYTAEWLDNESDRATVDSFTEAVVEDNPRMEIEEGDQIIDVPHGGSKEQQFTVNSTGNFRLEDYEAFFTPGNASSDWVEVEDSTKSSIGLGNTHTTTLNVTIPEGQPPSIYTGDLNFTSTNAQNISRDTDFSIASDASYNLPSTLNLSAVQGGSELLTTIDIEDTGNVNFTLDVFKAGNASEEISVGSPDLKRQRNTSLAVWYGNSTKFQNTGFFRSTLTLNSSNPKYSVPEKTVDLDIDVVEFSVGIKTENDTLEIRPGNETGVRFNVTLDNTIQTEDLSFDIKVNGTSADILNRSESGGVHTVNFTIPEVPDARTHDLKVEATKTTKEVTNSDSITSKYSIPDVTEPSIQKIRKENIEPLENMTLNITVSDNNRDGVLKGVDNVTVNHTWPNGSIDTIDVNTSGSHWVYRFVNLNRTGDHRIEVLAEDAANLTSTDSTVFRVEDRVSLGGDMNDSSGSSQKASMVFSIPETGERVLNTTLEGDYNISLQEGEYDLDVNFSDNTLKISGANLSSEDDNFIRMEELDGVDAPTPGASGKLMGIGVKDKLSSESVVIEMNYSEYKSNIPADRSIEDVNVSRCGDYSFSEISCNGDFETFSPANVSKAEETIEFKVSGFSSYSLFWPDQTSSQDQDSSSSSDSGGGGGGGGGTDLTVEQEEAIEKIPLIYNITSSAFNKTFALEDEKIEVFLQPGGSTSVTVTLDNIRGETAAFLINISGTIERFIEAPTAFAIPAGGESDLRVNITAPEDPPQEFYSGSLSFKNNVTQASMPVFIHIGAPSGERRNVIDLEIEPRKSNVRPGGDINVLATADALDFPIAKEVNLSLGLKDIGKDNRTLDYVKRSFRVAGVNSTEMSLQVPNSTALGTYILEGSLSYMEGDKRRVIKESENVQVSVPILERRIMGAQVSDLLTYLGILLLGALITYAGIFYYLKRKAASRRYKEEIDFGTLPEEDETGGSASIGKLADYDQEAYFGLDQIMTHVMVSGATGSGKTVTGQGMVEEALESGKNVIVLDPTAQWSGFLRECDTDEMLNDYGRFGMSREEAREYDGNIRALDSPDEDIDIRHLLQNEEESGNIIVFSLHKLEHKDIESFLIDMIEQVFEANLSEKDHLDTIIVFDEVHRLLEKFGGTEEGLNQLERGAREFRKWGVGMILVSQVLSDFPGEIRSNIGTKIQMRTRYKGDLEFYKTKYGIETVQSIVRENVGSGMIQNAEYNRGKPYWVDFRPLKHSPHRLTSEELDNYEDYNRQIDHLQRKIQVLEDRGEDVFDLNSTISLALKNLKKGSFDLVDIYLGEAKEKLEDRGVSLSEGDGEEHDSVDGDDEGGFDDE